MVQLMIFFMAADKDFPQKLKEKSATVGPIQTYAVGKLVMLEQ